MRQDIICYTIIVLLISYFVFVGCQSNEIKPDIENAEQVQIENVQHEGKPFFWMILALGQPLIFFVYLFLDKRFSRFGLKG